MDNPHEFDTKDKVMGVVIMAGFIVAALMMVSTFENTQHRKELHNECYADKTITNEYMHKKCFRDKLKESEDD